MPYVDLAGLSRFAGKFKDFASSECAGLDMANWQKTAAAGAVSFSPVPEMPLDSVVNFLFTETGPAEGTKAPDNPSTITGVTQAKVTRCGKNLLMRPYVQSTTTVNDVTFTVNDDGTVTANGTASDVTRFYLSYTSSGAIYKNGLTYMLSGCPSGGAWGTYYLGVIGPILNNSWNADLGAGKSFTPDGDGHLACAIVINSGTTVSNLVFKPQLELGSTATAFEAYEGTDYTIFLGGTFYGGNVDLSAGTMTVTHVCVELDGSYAFNNEWSYNSETGLRFFQGYGPTIFGAGTVNNSIACSHFINSLFSNNNVQNGTIVSPAICLTGVNGSQLRIAAPFSSADAFNAWLATQKSSGTPVLVVAELATPTTVQLTPTQIYSLSQPDPYAPRINTVYSDQTSVQVGYPKSPQASQNELTNAIVSLGGNV